MDQGACIHGVWLATPCTSWSRARHGPIGSVWGTLRDNNHLFGLAGLSSKDREKIQLGNQTMRITAKIVHLCHKFHIPCCLDNPAGSMMWLAPPISRVCHLSSSRCWFTIFVSMDPNGESEPVSKLGSAKIGLLLRTSAKGDAGCVHVLVGITLFCVVRTLFLNNCGHTAPNRTQLVSAMKLRRS